MAVRIASNITSLQSQRRLTEATSDLSSIQQRLSSGMRITKAADDAAALSIASSLNVDSQVYSQAIKNINDGASLLNITQGAVQQLSSIVTRQEELAEQAANGTYNYKQRSAMHREANALVSEYNRIIQTTGFNNINTLQGSTNSLQLQFGYGANGGINVGVGSQIGFAAGDGNVGLETAQVEVTKLYLNSVKTLVPGTNEVSTIRFSNTGVFSLGGLASYLNLEDGEANNYVVWFNVDGTHSDPTFGSGYGIEVALSNGDNELVIANKVAAALNSSYSALFSADTSSGHLVVTNQVQNDVVHGYVGGGRHFCDH